MKNLNIKVFFLFFFIAQIFYIASHLEKIDSDFFSIIENSDIKSHKDVINSLNDKLNKQILILLSDKKKRDFVMKKLENYNLFSKINHRLNDNFSQNIQDINKSKLALFSKEDLKILKNKPEEFFQKRAEEFFTPINSRILSVEDDFFNLSKSGIKNNSKVYFDIKDEALHVKHKLQDYLFINAILKQNYDSNELLKLAKELSNDDDIFISGGAIYAAHGKQNGEIQSIFMSIISLGLSGALLFFVFKNFRIFNLLLVCVFGLSSGLSFTFLFFDKVHVLCIAISSSLVGLMYDFAIHYLSFNTKQKVQINKLLKVFLIAFFITASGYLIFYLAPLVLLKQIAIFSIFALSGALVFTYFLLPLFFIEALQISKSTSKFINNYENFLKKFECKKIFLMGGFLLICLYTFSYLDFKDNIKSYSTIPQKWLSQVTKIAQITDFDMQTKFILTHDQGSNLIQELYQKNLIFSHETLDKYFLTPGEQKEAKELFLLHKNDEKILKIYTDFGFKKDEILKQFEKIANEKILNFDELLQLSAFENLKYLHFENKNIIFIKSKNDEEVRKIANLHNAFLFDFVSEIDKSFFNLKMISIKLKFIAFLIAFLFLCFFYGFKKSFLMISLIFVSSILTLFILTIFGFSINIFSIFGLILASAIGIDYMIFAFNDDLDVKQKLLAILLASSTTMISFFILVFSFVQALKVFGLSVTFSVLFCAFFASILSLKKI